MMIVAFALSLLTSTVAGQTAPCPPAGIVALRASLQQLLDSVVKARPDIAGVSVHVDAPKRCLSWSGAAGASDRATGTRLKPEQPHRIASITKTYVAAAVLRLAEEGNVSLDAPVTGLLSAESIELLRRGGYRPDIITVRHLLTHTSGIFDYAMSAAYQEAVNGNPTKRWTRAEQVRFAIDQGQPHGEPGSVFHYSDTGYILLGEIVERVTGQSMAAALRSLLGYDKNGWNATWFETLEPAPAGVADRAHQYMGDVDTYAFDPSFDLYGGGGLAATPRDMARFTRALFEGKVYRKKETLDLMLKEPGVPASRNYRSGIYARDVEGVRGFGHTGFWNTFAFHFPELDLTVAASLTQQVNAYDAAGAMLSAIVERAK